MNDAGHSGFVLHPQAGPTIRTARLFLRQPGPGDDVELIPIRNRPRVLDALNKTAITVQRMRENLDQVSVESMTSTAYSAVIEIAASSAVIGMVRLDGVLFGRSASLTVWVGHGQPERGCGREACKAMVDWGFEQLALKAIAAEVFGSNPASFSMLDGLGFVETGVEERETHLGWRRVTKYSLSSEAWADGPNADE